MPHKNIIPDESESDIWSTIAQQLSSTDGNLDYTAQFSAEKHKVTLDIDVSSGEGGEHMDPITSFRAVISDDISFRFKIEKQNLKHGIGKLFGMQDVIIGNHEFDKRFLIQTNDVAKVKDLLSNADVCAALLKPHVIDFQIKEYKIGGYKETVLILDLAGLIKDPQQLKEIYQPFKIVLNKLS